MESNSSTFSRRAFLRSVFAAGAATVAAGSLLGAASAQEDDVFAAASGYYRTLDYVNFRTGPGLGYSVIQVLPPQSPLTAIGPESGGYYKVSYQGVIGWVHSAYIATGNGGSSDYPPSLGYKTTTAYVNMRSGPGTGYSVIRTLPTGTTVEVSDSFQNNFQLMGYAQQTGWVSLDYLSGGGGQQSGQMRVTSALNLRTTPSLSGNIIKVMPAGTLVRPTDQLSNGFRYISLVDGSGSGWAYDDYLA
jgi:uncharacterized protein YraI